MKKTILPVLVVAMGLVCAQYIFGVDVERLAEGFAEFLTDIFNGPG